MDNNLLKQLIAQHRRVVIPDFGAFLKKEGPEGEQLVFSPFLRKDDGVVTDAIISEYGVESEDARAMVAEFVIYLRQSLAASGRYYIEGVGMLAVDANGTITLREGEEPPVEPEQEEPVEPETVPVQPVRPQPQAVQQPLPQQVRMQGQPQAGPQVQPQAGMTRPQSIQVQQPPVPPQPIQQPVQQPMAPPMPQQQQSFGGYPGMQQPMRSPVPPQPIQQPVQQPMAPPMPRPQPQMQQPMRPPMPGAGMQQQMAPPVPQQRPPIPPSQRQQPMPGNSMPGAGFGGNGGGMPPRGPQDPNMPQQHQQRPGVPGPNGGGRGPGGPRGPQQPGASQQGGRRPASRRSRPPKTKADMWLIVAIIAALVVIAIMVYSFIVSGNKGDIDMEMINAAMAPVQDTTAVVNPGEGGL